jgi:hypothetical protein
MRLPPSCCDSLFLRVFSVATLVVGIAFLLPATARGATQQLVCSPTTLRFGTVPVGKTESLLIALTNIGKTSVTISGSSVSNSAFQVSGLKFPVKVAAGQSVNLSMDFAPKTDEWTGGEVVFISTASNPKAILEMDGAGERSAALTAEPSSLSFGEVNLGTPATHSVVVTNNAALGVALTAWEAGGSGFSVKGPGLPVILAPHKSVTLDVTFNPKVAGDAGGSIFVLLPGLVVPLSGTGVSNAIGKLVTSPTSLNFGSEDEGTATAKDITLMASGGRITISSATSSNSEFSISGTSFPLTLNSGQSASLKVIFSPTKSGATTGTLTLASNASDGHAIESLSGTGVSASTTGKLLTSPASLNFGSENVGTETAKDITLTASGGRVIISSATSSNSEFSISGTSFPLTLNSGQSTSLKVVFAPTKSGAATASLTLSSNASDSRAIESLSGTAVTEEYSVDLSWKASASPVAGYNVYRGTTVGEYSQINSQLDASTSYTDKTVVAGNTYYYVATSVNSAGEQSGYSSPIEVKIP